MPLYRPTLLALPHGLTAAVFPLMKVFPAYACVRDAERTGRLDRSTMIVESSSGTMALGLALVCRWAQYNLTVVGDASCDPLVRLRLRELGADVAQVTPESGAGNAQRARLDKVADVCASQPNSWWVNQYDNPSNQRAYASLARHIARTLGRIDGLVGTVGSGGSVCGMARVLRETFPDLAVIGVDTFGSVLFGQADRPRTLRGLGNSIMPANLDHTLFDEVHWVTAAEAFTATRMLHRETGLFRGGTSGACWLVARDWAARHPRSMTLCLFADDGHRYVSSIYDDEYLARERLWLDELPQCPAVTLTPHDTGPSWSYMQWERRRYEDVTGLDRAVLACTRLGPPSKSPAPVPCEADP